ncbi:MAG: hypothetical protein AAB728_01850 [Patescibacteria group bacterium]
MPHPLRKCCLVEGCSAQTHGKPYCHAHGKDRGKTVLISTEQRARMRSDCCNAPVTDGQRHEYGRQYCLKCKGACCWHTHMPILMSQLRG